MTKKYIDSWARRFKRTKINKGRKEKEMSNQEKAPEGHHNDGPEIKQESNSEHQQEEDLGSQPEKDPEDQRSDKEEDMEGQKLGATEVLRDISSKRWWRRSEKERALLLS